MAGSGFHRDAVGLDNHVPHSFTYADATARVAAVSTDFTDPDDLFKLARQTSDTTYWVLEQITPTVVWNQLGGGGGAAELPFDAITDPAADAAVTTAKIDLFSGTVITLTAAGNSQTLGAPTDTTAGRKFFVINNDTSTSTITVNGILLGSGQYGEWRWDGTAWLFPAGGVAGAPGGLDSQIQYNNAGVFDGDANHTWDDVGKKETVIGDLEQVAGTTTLLYTPTQVSATIVGTNPRFAVVQANYLYVCDANDNNLRIYDVTDPAAPAFVGSVVIGGGRGVDVAGRYVYYTDEDNGGRLVIVDVIDKSNPTVVGSVVTGGSPRGVKVQGTIAVLTYNSSVDGIRTFDVSDPTAPVQLGTRAIANAGRTDLDIRDNTVAIPTSTNVQLFDISDPTNIVLLTEVSPGGSFSCKFQGRYLYLSDEDVDQFQVWDTVDPSIPVLVGTLALVAPSSIRAISVSGNFAYFVDASNDEMRVVDISDPTAPVFISTAVSVGLNPIAITTVGRYAYVLDNNGDQFLIMNLGGIDAQNLNVGNIDAGSANLRKDLKMGGVVSAGGGTFGAGGIFSDGDVAAKGRVLGGKPQNVVEIYRETDFPIVSTDIVLAVGTVYVLMAPVSTDKQILHPASGGAFSPARIVSSNKELNTLTSTGTGGAFLRTQSGQGQLILQSLIINSTGSRVFADVSGLTQTALLTELDDTALSGFNDGSVFDTCIFNVNNNSFWNGIGDITMIDAEGNWSDMFTANTTDSLMPTLDLRSGAGSVQPSFLSVRDSKLSSHPNEDFFMIHSNLIAGSTVRINGVEDSPFTPGTGGFFATQTGSITALADSAGAPGVRTIVSAAGHNVADGDTFPQSGFATQTQNNGTFVASDVVAGVSYEIVAVFVATDTGTWTNNSLDQTDPKVAARDNPGQADSKTIGSCHVNSNATVTVIVTLNTYTDLNLNASALAGSNIERWSLTNTTTGELTYDGIEPLPGTISAQLSTLGETGSPEYRFRAVKNGVALADGIETVREAGAVQIVTTGLVAPVSVVTGDTIRLQVNNIDDAEDITITHLSVSIQ